VKLLRCGPRGAERPAVLDRNGRMRDLSSVVQDIDSKLLAGNFSLLANLDTMNLPEIAPDARIGPPLSFVGKFLCIGLNYRDHAAESNMAIPEEPIVFMKATSAICGPNDNVVLPPGAKKGDWEVELGVVIGRECRYVSEREAMDHVAGVCVINDLSEREFQLERGGQWDKGKGCDTFGPIGPYLVTRDEAGDLNNLDLWLEVNGMRMQNGNTKNMIFGVPFLVHYLSQFMSLQPGDVISTGTPAGVGLGMKPQVWLKEGDVMKLGIAGLGEQHQKVVRYGKIGSHHPNEMPLRAPTR
jgi:2-keto-4-pentenoate hydratase/2-oxohepta-3-ene-1,7-dioic acid hydratase in catechol pathway